MKIGIFDSGIGGLTVLEKLKATPGLELFYFADFKNLPYGDKSADEICYFVDRIVQFFLRKNIMHIVIACNTATVASLHVMQKKYPNVVFIEAIDIAIFEAVSISNNKKIGLMATPFVAQSLYYDDKLQLLSASFSFYKIACSELASFIESSDHNSIDYQVKKYVAELKGVGVDTLILGCTHYGFVQNTIQTIAPGLKIITSDNHVKSLMPVVKKEGHVYQHIPSSVFYFSSSKHEKIYDSSDSSTISFDVVDL